MYTETTQNAVNRCRLVLSLSFSFNFKAIWQGETYPWLNLPSPFSYQVGIFTDPQDRWRLIALPQSAIRFLIEISDNIPLELAGVILSFPGVRINRLLLVTFLY